ncbi:Uncharacterized protein Rs2_27907 [Raphanus sativus]|nr:Uncharacterized protein Rs2_27907 [Raphanus sativus]
MKPSGFDSDVVASLLVMTAGNRCCSMEAVCLDCYRVMFSDGKDGEDEDGCVTDACRESGPMKRHLSLAAVFHRFQAPIIPPIQSLEVGFVGIEDGDDVSPIWMGSIREVGDQNLFFWCLDLDLVKRRRVFRAVVEVDTWMVTGRLHTRGRAPFFLFVWARPKFAYPLCRVFLDIIGPGWLFCFVSAGLGSFVWALTLIIIS